ncbi:hypothetical protein I4U23_003698 [Adineta vaga]|nr:hypothetical protein I4U23_003698 [Adineta vaga]
MFHFIYLSNRSFSDFYHYVQPNYICFYPKDCLQLVKDAIDIGLNNGLICYYTNDISEESITNETQIRKVLDKLFLRCVTTGIERTCSHSSLFHCSISLKCISKHRLVDGISDCYYNEDELFDSCQLNDSQRFICSSEPNKCLAPIALYNRKYECQGKEDEMDEIQRNILKGYVPIGLICDGVKEQLLEHANDTDETDCKYWPCNNPYTRCNGVSTCLDGTDELNCPLLEYSINTGQCSKQIVTNLFCERAIHSIANKFDSKIVHVTNNTVLDYATNKNRTKCFITPKCYSLPQICQFDVLNTLFDQLCHLPEALVCLLELFYWKPILRTNICHFNLYTSSKDDQVQSAFTSTQLGYFPIVSSALSNSNNSNMKTTTSIETLTKTFKNWYCNRGILVFHKNNQTKTCLCPPTYFGHRCQWQNQRLSLTFQFIYQTNTYNTILIFQLIIMLIDQQKHMTSYHEQILYIPKENCDTKYNIYLLYPTRPKNLSINYTIHIDIFDKVTLTYYGSWFLSIPFLFLPVNRIATQIFIPATPKMISKSCPLVCGHHGQCVEYLNQNNSYFCQCHQGYSGLHCHIPHHCSCSSDSLCLSSSICVCPVNKFGSKCYLNHSICQQSTNPCQNHGFCVPVDDRMGLKKFFCLCPDGFSGRTCEHHQNRIDIRFDPKKITMTPFIYVHSIRALKNDNHQYTTILKKVHPEQNLLTIYVKFPFHLIFIELFDHKFYLAVLREKFLESEHIQANIVFNQRCFHISELMNKLFLNYSFLHRVKYYPLLCQENLHLMCFYDERQMKKHL